MAGYADCDGGEPDGPGVRSVAVGITPALLFRASGGTPVRCPERCSVRGRLIADVRSMHGANAAAVVFRFNPVVRGWSAYY
jgi:hypothetical protein